MFVKHDARNTMRIPANAKFEKGYNSHKNLFVFLSKLDQMICSSAPKSSPCLKVPNTMSYLDKNVMNERTNDLKAMHPSNFFEAWGIANNTRIKEKQQQELAVSSYMM